MVDRSRDGRERKRRGWLFAIASIVAHVAIAGLLGVAPAPTTPDERRETTIPLALFSPGSGSVAAAAPPSDTTEPADESTGENTGAAPPRRGRARSTPTATHRSGETAAAPPTDPAGADVEVAGTGDELSNEAFIDALMASAGPARPSPGACPDPVVGTWKARRFDPDMSKQAEFLLRIRENDDGRLSGRITLRAWSGRTPRPPRCAPGVFFHTVRMPARGRFEGGRLSFEGTSFTRMAHCIDPGFRYNIDHFTGSVRGDTFRAVNNDGGHEVDTPYTFERIACH